MSPSIRVHTRHATLAAVGAAFALSLAACGGGDGSGSSITAPPGSTTTATAGGSNGGTGSTGSTGTSTGGSTPKPSPNAGLVTGAAVDAAGRPLADATVSAENTAFDGSWVQGGTDAQGHYSLDVKALPATWHMRAWIWHEYNGHLYQFDLHPDNNAAFAGADGAVRNFDWRLTGERPNSGGLQFYGSRVNVYPDLAPLP